MEGGIPAAGARVWLHPRVGASEAAVVTSRTRLLAAQWTGAPILLPHPGSMPSCEVKDLPARPVLNVVGDWEKVGRSIPRAVV